jgi:hypothetical protein
MSRGPWQDRRVPDRTSGRPGNSRPARLVATETALTCHVVRPDAHPADDVLHHAAEELEEPFGIGHVTLQPELEEPSAAHPAGVHNH